MLHLMSSEIFFALVGILFVARFLVKVGLRLCRFIRGHFLSSRINFKQLGQYAVVTGSTDGIGKAYAFELASRGLNIVLVSRTLSRLLSTADELRQKYPRVDVRVIEADFEKYDVYERIEHELADVDVGVLVNNVGAAVTPLRLLARMPRADIWKMININVVSTVVLSQIALQKMVAKRRGLIVNISSAMAVFPPVYVLYSPMKAFIQMFSHGLRLQYASLGITVQDLQPFFVTTKLARNITGRTVVSPETCVQQSIRTIGHYDETHGAVIHEIKGFLLSILPNFVFFKVMNVMNGTK